MHTESDDVLESACKTRCTPEKNGCILLQIRINLVPSHVSPSVCAKAEHVLNIVGPHAYAFLVRSVGLSSIRRADYKIRGLHYRLHN